MRCPSCARESPEATRFCGYCGAHCAASLADTPTFAAPSPPASPELRNEGRFPIGRVISDRYRILNLVGLGGMGQVYRALDLRLDQFVAIKFLPESAVGAANLAERLLSEVRIARQITHQNVCRVYDIGEVDEQPFITMEYVDGEDLHSLLRRIGRLPPDRAEEMAKHLCLGLAAAHEKGALHRDLKPGNIMIDSRGHLLITDFGLASLVGTHQTDEPGGTPAYMAPEQLAGKPASIQSDLYSLGLVLFEMFTGKEPFDCGSARELADAREAGIFAAPSTLVLGIDPAIDRIIAKCLDPDPRARPVSALAVAAALPGADRLAATVAAGRIPSPEMIAASGTMEGLRPRVALFCLAAVIVALVLFTMLSARASLIELAHLERSPESLDEAARRIIQSFGYIEPAGDRAHGFVFDSRSLERQHNHDSSGSPTAASPRIAFWYRESPGHLEPQSFMCCDLVPGGIGFRQPPPKIPGERLVLLSTAGELEYAEAVPQSKPGLSPAPAIPDWSAIFTFAGLRMEDFHSALPQGTPPFFADQRASWLRDQQPGSSPRVEAAALGGRVIFFEKDPAFVEEHTERQPSTPSQRAGDAISVALITAVTTIGVWLALRNLRLRRVDRRGAFRLLAIGYLLDSSTWALLGAHVPEMNYEWRLLEMAASWASFRAAVLWLSYVALEPYVRRRWPHGMISWSRLLAGRVGDPKLGGDVLIGVVSGCTTAVLFQLKQALTRPSVDLGPLIALKGPRHAAGLWLADLHSSVVLAFLTVLLFLLLRTVLRRDWLAAAAFCLIQGGAVGTQNLADGIVTGLQYLLVVLFLIRFGFVTIATGIFVYTILFSFPITSNVSSWYFGTSLFALLSVGVLASLAFRATLGGRSLTSDDSW